MLSPAVDSNISTASASVGAPAATTRAPSSIDRTRELTRTLELVLSSIKFKALACSVCHRSSRTKSSCLPAIACVSFSCRSSAPCIPTSQCKSRKEGKKQASDSICRSGTCHLTWCSCSNFLTASQSSSSPVSCRWRISCKCSICGDCPSGHQPICEKRPRTCGCRTSHDDIVVFPTPPCQSVRAKRQPFRRTRNPSGERRAAGARRRSDLSPKSDPFTVGRLVHQSLEKLLHLSGDPQAQRQVWHSRGNPARPTGVLL
eukprot:SAG11_NODE_9868_length_874_cov_1.209032_1_plen_258_part_01